MQSQIARPAGRALVAVALLLASFVSLAMPQGARAQDGGLALVDVEPAPWTLQTSTRTPTAISVRVTGVEDPGGTAEFLLDGQVVGSVPVFRGRATLETTLPVGKHLVRVDVISDDGDRATRSWPVTVTEATVERLAGATRIDTALAIAAEVIDGVSAPALVLARADAFPDGLAGGPLAAQVGGPLVLTDGDVLSPAVADRLPDLVRDGGTIHVLGGPAAVSDQVVDGLRRDGYRVVRSAGDTRYATAVAIADRLASPDRVFVASGTGFADALAASAVAAAAGEPVLLTPPDRLDDDLADWLVEAGVDEVVVVGGPVAVADGVVVALEALADVVVRVAGKDRYATAALIADRYAPPGSNGRVVLASGRSFPDALAGGPLAAASGAPVLLTERDELPVGTDAALRGRGSTTVTVLGGTAVVGSATARLLPAMYDGPSAPRLVSVTPSQASPLASLDAGVVLTFDRPIDTADVHARLSGSEEVLAATVDGATVTVRPRRARDEVVRGVGGIVFSLTGQVVADGVSGTIATTHEVAVPDDVFATASGIELHEPSSSIDMIGFHQANHDGARLQVVRDNGTRTVVMSSRGRETGLTSAADIVAEPGVAITSPVTGWVVRGGTYTLYCRHTDNFLVIEPDGFPGFEVKLLHFQGRTVGAGDRVDAGTTVIGSGPTQLPFRSQVDEHSSTGWPHVHLEVVDTSIPDKPNSGSGSDGC